MFMCNDDLNLYNCKLCQYATNVKCYKSSHVCNNKKISEVKWIECEHCKIPSFSILWTFRHQIKCLNMNQVDGIPSEVRKNRNKPNTKKHLNKVKVEKLRFKCDYCEFKAPFKCFVTEHIRNRHKSSDLITWHKCDQCNYKSKYLFPLTKHMTSKHLQKIKEEFKCAQCSYTTHTKPYLSHHVRYVHSTINLYECEECDFKTKYQKSLKNHNLLKHTNNVEKKYKCSECSYQSHIAGQLQQHKKFIHTAYDLIEWHKCDKCDYKTKRASLLKSHQRTGHEIVQCERCNYATRIKTELKQHLFKIHNIGGKMFKCTECNFATFSKQASLNRHMLARHTPDNLKIYFRCNLCTAKFKTNCSLLRHLKKIHQK